MVPQFGFNQYLFPEHALPSRKFVSELAAVKEEELIELLRLILPDGPAKNASSSLAKGVIGVASAIAAVEATLEGDPLAATVF